MKQAAPRAKSQVSYSWTRYEAGWYLFDHVQGTHSFAIRTTLASVCFENQYDCPPGKCWCVYVKKGMPPGDAQFGTLREAKAWTENKVTHKST